MNFIARAERLNTTPFMISTQLTNALKNLGIQVTVDDIPALRSTIVTRLAAVHPDRTGGKFANEDQHNEFQQVKTLLEQLDQETALAGQLIPMQQVSTLIEAIAKAQSMSVVNPHVEELTAKQQYSQHVRRKYAFPKITSAILASLCFLLISFLGNFKNSPFYRIAANFAVQDERVKIINRINVEGGEIKESVFQAYYDEGGDFSIPRRETQYLRNFLEDNTTVTDVDLFASDETTLFKVLEQANIKNQTTIAGHIESLERLLKNRPENGKYYLDEDLEVEIRALPPYIDDSYKSYFTVAHLTKKLDYQKTLPGMLTAANESIAATRDWIPEAKRKALKRADSRILTFLAVITILAVALFIVIWTKERSDESWVEYVSTDVGLESVLTKLCLDKEIKSRSPARFSLSEFTNILGTKDVPRLLAPIMGSHLDNKHLGQITSMLLRRLVDRRVIKEIETPTIQTWYEIKIKEEATEPEENKFAQ